MPGDQNDAKKVRRSKSPSIDGNEIKQKVKEEMNSTKEFIKERIDELSLIDIEMSEDNKSQNEVIPLKNEIIVLKDKVSCLETALHEKMYSKAVTEAKYSIVRDELIDLKSKLEIANAELNARPYIELLQRKAMPAWLLNDEDLTAESKWVIAFQFRLTRCARILVYRIDTMEPNVGHTIAATILHNYSYDVFSEILEHKKKVRPLRLSDEGWLSFFGKVGIEDPVEQEVFKSLVEPITEDEYVQNPIIKNYGKNRYVFLVKYLDIEPKDGESEATCHIKMICGKPLVDSYYPRNRSGKYSNMVVFLLESCNSKDAFDISERLKSNPRKGCNVSVKYDIYNPNL